MAEITAAMVRELREATNLGMMECKKALTDAGGNRDKAIKILREQGMLAAQQRSARVAKQGLIAACVKDDGRTAGMVEVNCETDFVARTESFSSFAERLAARACQVDGSLADAAAADVAAKIAELGENIVLRRNVKFAAQGTGRIAAYIHHGATLGVLVEVGFGKAESASSELMNETVKDVAMQIAASSPTYVSPAEIPADLIASEREIYAKQITNKPDNIVQKIVDGKIKKFYSEVCLLDQPFVKEPKQSVSAYLADRGKATGDTITVKRFIRYRLGEL